MKTIWKYMLFSGPNFLGVPKDSIPLKFGEQGGAKCVWYMVDTEKKISDTCCYVYATGEEIMHSEDCYFDSVVMQNGLVWHLFLGERAVRCSQSPSNAVDNR